MSFIRDMKDFLRYDSAAKVMILIFIAFVIVLLLSALVIRNRNGCELIDVSGVQCILCEGYRSSSLSCKW